MAKRAPKRTPMTPEQREAFAKRLAAIEEANVRNRAALSIHYDASAKACGQTRAEYDADLSRTAEKIAELSDGAL